MKSEYITIGYTELGLCSLLILMNMIFSILLRLGLEKRLLIATLRMTIQLLLVGYILEWIFALRNPWIIIAMAIVMTTIAGVSAVHRTGSRFPGIYWNSLVSILTASFLVTGIAMTGIIRPVPWFNPQYSLPILGMLLGNSLNGITLGLDRFMENLVRHRYLIDTWLALGATRWEAAQADIRDAVRTGMIPIVNSMMVMGIVSLPGMMTGQILGGVAPVDAVRYQIAIVFMIAAATALGTVSVILLSFFVLFSPQHRLLFHLIKQMEKN